MSKRAKAYIPVFLLCAVVGAPSLHAGWTTDGAPVCVYSGDQEYPVICPDDSGGAYIAWEDRRGYPDIWAQRVDENGRRLWAEEGIPICTASYGQYGPRICSDGAGGVIIAWTDARASNVRDIYAQRVAPNGDILWAENGEPVCTETAHQRLNDMCPDGAGGALLVWQDERVNSEWDDIYCQRIDSDGTVLWTASGVPLSTGISFLREEAHVVSDLNGGGIFSWIDWGSGGIFAQRVNAGGSVLWTANGEAVCNASGNQYGPRMAPDGSGGAVVVWYDHRSWYDIYVQRVDTLGNMLWTANGVQLTDDGVDDIWQAYCGICGDGEGGAIVAWIDQRDGDYDCYAQRVNGSGTAQWPVNGVAICTAAGSSDAISLLSVSDKGAILAWEDSRSAMGNDVYTQRIDSLGAVGWSTDGIAVCTAENSQNLPMIVTDGADGAIIAWEDDRVFGDKDIYARRVTFEGEFVATLVQSHCASFGGSSVVIEWTLSEIDDNASFAVSRAVFPGDDFVDLAAENLSREGLTFRYDDTGCMPGVTYVYRVFFELDGERDILFTTETITPPAAELSLRQNYPNPFNPSTTISYYLPVNCHVELTVYDPSGHVIRRLFDGEQAAGPQSVTWNGLNGSGKPVESGVYLYGLKAGKETRSRKMLLIR